MRDAPETISINCAYKRDGKGFPPGLNKSNLSGWHIENYSDKLQQEIINFIEERQRKHISTTVRPWGYEQQVLTYLEKIGFETCACPQLA